MFDMNPNEVREHAYLVARGVRPLAIAGNCLGDDRTMFETAASLEALGCHGAIPFVFPREDGHADYGYAASAWCIDLLRWAESNAVPEKHRHRIVGLLLGYSVDAIRMFEEQNCGRLFNELPGAAS
jgi:hypothetical protein